MKKIFLIILAITFNFVSFAQQDPVHDPKAKEILDKLSSKMSKDTTVRIFFEYNIYNATDSSQDSFTGYLFVKGEKYKLIIPKAETFCDGKKVYTYNIRSNEMNINFYDPENADILTPSKILNVYKKGFKYRLRTEVTFDAKVKTKNGIGTQSKTCYIVDLYPENPKSVPYSIIRLWIDKNKNELVSIMYQGKNGIQQVVNILEYKGQLFINDKMFQFDKNKYPKDIEIIDFTE